MPLLCSVMQRKRSSMIYMVQRKQAAQVTTEIHTVITTSLVVMRVSFVHLVNYSLGTFRNCKLRIVRMTTASSTKLHVYVYLLTAFKYLLVELHHVNYKDMACFEGKFYLIFFFPVLRTCYMTNQRGELRHNLS